MGMAQAPDRHMRIFLRQALRGSVGDEAEGKGSRRREEKKYEEKEAHAVSFERHVRPEQILAGATRNDERVVELAHQRFLH